MLVLGTGVESEFARLVARQRLLLDRIRPFAAYSALPKRAFMVTTTGRLNLLAQVVRLLVGIGLGWQGSSLH